MRNAKEYQVCKSLSTYIRFKYPKVIFHWDLAGLNLSRAQAGMMKTIQGGRGWPDLFIAEPRLCYHGLFLEVKKNGTNIFLKDGKTFVSDTHIREQHEMLLNLSKRGFFCCFCVGVDECIKIIDEYLNLK